VVLEQRSLESVALRIQGVDGFLMVRRGPRPGLRAVADRARSGTVRVTRESIMTSTHPVARHHLLADGSPFRLARRTLNRSQSIDSELVIKAMSEAGADHLVHYAGAAYRDAVAWQMCAAWLADPSQPEHVLKSRAVKAAWGWDVAPEAFLAQAVR
jgi:hypothetical protein